MWIKICANTNLDDAKLAAELGADALGFVFAPSPRRVTPEQVAAITAQLPSSVEKIGVFTSVDIEKIAYTVQTGGLTGVQFSGSFSSNSFEALKKQFPGLRILYTHHWQNDDQHAITNFPRVLRALRSEKTIDAVLIDSRTATASGGTGIAFDWEAARQALSALGPKRLIVAGGLNAGNVQQAIATLDPWGVDVASGVESVPGKKDPQKLAAFLSTARSAPIGAK